MNASEMFSQLEEETDLPVGLNLALVENKGSKEFYWWIPSDHRYSQGFETEADALKALRAGSLWFMAARIH